MTAPLRCEASLVALARTRATDGERRGARAPAFRVCPGTETRPRAGAQGRMMCAEGG
jgi:hypothetical protein